MIPETAAPGRPLARNRPIPTRGEGHALVISSPTMCDGMAAVAGLLKPSSR